MRRHTDREYDQELEKLRERVLLMGAKVEHMIDQAMKSFSERRPELGRATIEQDSQIDALELEIDELCLQLLARRQPMASDLRFITTSLKLVTDLERIGDLAVNISERAVELCNETPSPGQASIPRIATVAQAMLHDALDAFVAGDAGKAEAVIERDRIVDAYYAQLFPELVTTMMMDPALVHCSTKVLSTGKYLERIADHATNIAEMVVFMVRGQDVRHSGAAHVA